MLLTCIYGDIIFLLWGIVILGTILVGYYIYLKFLFIPKEKDLHECKMKEAAHKREQFWHSERQKEEAAKRSSVDEQVKELQAKLSELERKLKWEESNSELLKKQIDIYKSIFDKLNVEFKQK